jgi:outer membrane protein OmpA-like peptidoglycan-associated protein
MKNIVAIFLFLPLFAASQNKEQVIVHFNFEQFNLTAAAKVQLDSFIAANKNSTTSIQLHGHCDVVGSNAYNDVLSKKRVQAVKNYLQQNNIPVTSFVTAKGHGKRVPLNNNVSAEERLLNRRVEIIILKNIAVTLNNTTPEIKTDTAVALEVAVPVIPEKNLSEQLDDTATKSGVNIILKNINFVGARHQFLPESYSTLKELLAIMLKNKTLKIQVQGHICCLPGNVDGFDEETETNNLSELRARAVRDYLIEHGVDLNRVTYVGLGHTQPIYAYPEKTQEEMKLNRRVTIQILSK